MGDDGATAPPVAVPATAKRAERSGKVVLPMVVL